MRAGAGYVTALRARARCSWSFELRLLEVMTRGAARRRTAALGRGGVDAVLRRAERGGALVLGPGLGRSRGRGRASPASWRAGRRAAAAARRRRPQRPRRRARARSRARGAPTVLTPHAGELARLLGARQRRGRAPSACATRAAAAERSGAIVVLKGDDTLVAEPDGRVAVSPAAAPALATAGTGDVLSGVIGALLAQGHGAVRRRPAPACGCTRAAGRARGRRARRRRRDRLRRDRRAAGAHAERWEARLSVPPRAGRASTSPRSSATARACGASWRGGAAALRRRQGRRLRPRHRPGAPARRSPAARRWLAVADRRGGRASCARPGSTAPLLVLGALQRRGARRSRCGADADVVAVDASGSCARSRRAGRRGARARQARHRHGPARHARPGRGDARRRGGRRGARARARRR